MSTEETHSGIPTRAIHEAYLDMIRSLKEYRQAQDYGDQYAQNQAHGELQQDVLTFYELLRPHIREESNVRDWWEGELPSYNGDGSPPDPDDGKAILQVQTQNDVQPIPETDETLDTLQAWHDALGYNGNKRIVGISRHEGSVFVSFHQYQKGLRHLDNWETAYKRVVRQKDGFQSDKRETQVERQRIPIDRLQNAVRELSDVAQKLGALSDFDASSTNTEITDEQLKRLEKWRQRKLDE